MRSGGAISSCDAILVIASVRTVHHEAPGSAGPEVEAVRCCREAVGTPPVCKMFRIGEGREDQIARRIEHSATDDRARIGFEIDAIFCAHSSSPSLAGF